MTEKKITHTITLTDLTAMEMLTIEATSEELRDLHFWIASIRVAETSKGSVKLLHQFMNLIKE